MAGTNRVWHIEQNGINPVPDDDRRMRLAELFWIWFGANLAVVGVVLGAVVMSFGLSFLQGVLVAALGLLSYALVGYFGLPGVATGTPTLALARAAFGTYGNVLPSLLSWLNLVGWEVVVVVTATYALEGAWSAAFHVPATPLLTALAFLVVLLVSFGVALLGHATIARIQTVFSYVFGLLTAVVFALLLPKVHWHALLSERPGSWLDGFLPALSVVVAGTGLSWVMTGADYTRYLPHGTRPGAVIWATTVGSFIPAFALLLLGILLSASLPGLASTSNPVALIGRALPAWMAVPYLVTAAAGMITGDILDIYSSGLSLLAAHVRVARYKTVFIDAALSVAGAVYILFVAKNFTGPFVAFLTLLAGVLAPWAGVFFVDARRRLASGYEVGELAKGRESAYGAVRWPGMLAFLVGVGVSLLLTSSPFFTGPLAKGIFAGSSLGFLVGFAVSALLYAALDRPQTRSLRAPGGEKAVRVP